MEQENSDVFLSYSRDDYVDDKNNVIPESEVSKNIETTKKKFSLVYSGEHCSL